ncbi:MAG: aminoglycoside phosphotransferase [Planctomycetota bacterium]|jgi:aminoglycoside phosphotransferase
MELWGDLDQRYQADESEDKSSIDATNELVFLKDNQGDKFVLKRYQSARAQRRELNALTHWSPLLSFPCPEIVRALTDPAPSILMTRLPGRTPTPDESDSIELSQVAGRALRELHDLDIENQDAMPLWRAMELRFREVIESARPWLVNDLLGFVAGVSTRLSDLPARTRVPCHGDYVGRNWQVDGSVPFALLDFENAHMDVAETDFLKLHMESWPQNEAAKSAFIESYGTTWDEGVTEWISVLEILYLIGTVNWNLAMGLNDEAIQARKTLDRIRLKNSV